MALDPFSYRIACVVTLAVRLFDKEVEAHSDVLPTKGPSEREGMKPTLTETGVRGEDDFRRVWTIAPPTTGASASMTRDVSGGTIASLATETSRLEELSGFELPPLPDATTEQVPDGYAGPVLIGDRGDENVVFGRVLARKVRLRFNAHRTADECEIELPIGALPLPADGSLIRAIMVEVRRGVVAPDAWADAMARSDAAFAMPLASDADDPDFVGFADVHRLRMPSDGAMTVSLPCRDFFGILADTELRGRTIRNDVPVDEAIAEWLGTIPAMVGMRVVWRGPESPPTLADHAAKAKKSKKGKPLRSAQQKTQKQSCLDALIEYCTLAGVIVTVRGYALELGAPRTMNQIKARGVRRMILGQNIRDLELEHKLTKAHLRVVEVRSFNSDTGQVLAARYPFTETQPGEFKPGELNALPPENAVPLHAPPGVSAFDEHSAEVFIVQDVTDHDRLRDIARATWEEMARQDVTGKITTRDIATIEGRAQGVADLLALRAGDPLAIEIAPSIEETGGSFIQRLAALPRDRAADMLVERGWIRSVAERIVDGILATSRPFIFYTREVEFTWGVDSGTEMTISLVNFVEVLDEELLGGRPRGGNRALVAKDKSATFEDKWKAIELDMMAGEIDASTASKLQTSLVDSEHVEDLGGD